MDILIPQTLEIPFCHWQRVRLRNVWVIFCLGKTDQPHSNGDECWAALRSMTTEKVCSRLRVSSNSHAHCVPAFVVLHMKTLPKVSLTFMATSPWCMNDVCRLCVIIVLFILLSPVCLCGISDSEKKRPREGCSCISMHVRAENTPWGVTSLCSLSSGRISEGWSQGVSTSVLPGADFHWDVYNLLF